MYPQVDALEIQNDDIYLNPSEEPELLSHYFKTSSQVEPEQIQIGSLKIDSLGSGPESNDLPVGTILPSVDAVGWIPGNRNVDIRPRLVDSSTGQARLLDSGAQISATQKRPEDKIDQSMSVVAVNGSKIQTYGTRVIELKIGRKMYFC